MRSAIPASSKAAKIQRVNALDQSRKILLNRRVLKQAPEGSVTQGAETLDYMAV